MRVPFTLDSGDWEALRRLYEQVARIINGRISLGWFDGTSTVTSDNIDGVWAVVSTPGVPNTDFTVTHNLGRIVTGYIVAAKGAACDVYTSPTANGSPTTQFIFRATAGTVTVRMFIF